LVVTFKAGLADISEAYSTGSEKIRTANQKKSNSFIFIFYAFMRVLPNQNKNQNNC